MRGPNTVAELQARVAGVETQLIILCAVCPHTMLLAKEIAHQKRHLAYLRGKLKKAQQAENAAIGSPTVWDLDTTNARLGTILWQSPGDDEQAQSILRWAVMVYSYLLPPGQYMYKDFAAAIARVYDGENPKTKAALELLRAL